MAKIVMNLNPRKGVSLGVARLGGKWRDVCGSKAQKRAHHMGLGCDGFRMIWKTAMIYFIETVDPRMLSTIGALDGFLRFKRRSRWA